MADYSLYGMVESGNAYKAALMLQLCGLDWEPVWVDFFNGETRTEAFRKLNPMGEVPVVIDHTQDDLVLTQSGVILYHLAEKTGKFGARNDEESREILRWILFDNHKLTNNNAVYRFLRIFMQQGNSPEAEFLKARGLSALKLLNQHLESREFVAADRATIADISLCGYLFWPDHIGVEWKDFPGIEAWLKRIQSLENWAPPEDILPGTPEAG